MIHARLARDVVRTVSLFLVQNYLRPIWGKFRAAERQSYDFSPMVQV